MNMAVSLTSLLAASLTQLRVSFSPASPRGAPPCRGGRRLFSLFSLSNHLLVLVVKSWRYMSHVHEYPHWDGKISVTLSVRGAVRPDVSERVVAETSPFIFVSEILRSPWPSVVTTVSAAVRTSWSHGFAGVVHSCVHEMTARVERVDEFPGFGKLNETLLEVSEGSFHEALRLLVVVEEVVPERLAGKNLGVSNNDHGVLGSRQSHIQS